MNETQFENELIACLCGSRAAAQAAGRNILRETPAVYAVGKRWQYAPHIKTTEDLWQISSRFWKNSTKARSNTR